jgi:UDP-2,4-diacetamido-2,4,6-trideoxy-beta-L-altropyranose hydrolase
LTQRSSHLRIAFRTDASIQIGTGHVMRCVTLATALRGRGAECVFLCRPHEGHLFDLISEHGFTVLAIEGPRDAGARGSDAAAPAHADWLGVTWQGDAAVSRAALSSHFADTPVDWLVVDHYGLDARWERSLRGSCDRLLVIDDLADRPHDCDLLLDQSLGRVVTDYAGLIPEGATALIGPSYALLRPEFACLRDESLARRAEPKLERLLVTLGGVDKDNMTTQVLDALDASALPANVRVTVVMGPHAPWLDTVRSRAARMRYPTEVLVDVRNIARLMAESDLSIGAGGTTTFERCCVGLPSLTLVLAANQDWVASKAHDAGAAIAVRTISDLASVLGALLASNDLCGTLARLALAAAEVTDGVGVNRLANRLIEDHD